MGACRGVGMVAVVVLATLSGSAAEGQEPAGGEAVPEAQRRIEIAIGAREEGPMAPVLRGVGSLAAGVRVPTTALLYRFRVQVRVPAEAAAARPDWEMTIRSSAGVLVTLTSDAADVSLPRPLGYLVTASESLHVVARIAPSDAAPELRLVIEFEPMQRAPSRLGVLPMQEVRHDGPSAAGSGTARTWTWIAAANGRLLALAGAALGPAHDLVLEDVTTGVLVWRTTIRQRASGATPVVRLGIAVQAGRIYRLTLTPLSSSFGREAAGGTLVAVELPIGEASDQLGASRRHGGAGADPRNPTTLAPIT